MLRGYSLIFLSFSSTPAFANDHCTQVEIKWGKLNHILSTILRSYGSISPVSSNSTPAIGNARCQKVHWRLAVWNQRRVAGCNLKADSTGELHLNTAAKRDCTQLTEQLLLLVAFKCTTNNQTVIASQTD